MNIKHTTIHLWDEVIYKYTWREGHTSSSVATLHLSLRAALLACLDLGQSLYCFSHQCLLHMFMFWNTASPLPWLAPRHPSDFSLNASSQEVKFKSPC